MIHNGRSPGQVNSKPGEVSVLLEANSLEPSTVTCCNQLSPKKYHLHSNTIGPDLWSGHSVSRHFRGFLLRQILEIMEIFQSSRAGFVLFQVVERNKMDWHAI